MAKADNELTTCKWCSRVFTPRGIHRHQIFHCKPYILSQRERLEKEESKDTESVAAKEEFLRTELEALEVLKRELGVRERDLTWRTERMTKKEEEMTQKTKANEDQKTAMEATHKAFMESMAAKEKFLEIRMAMLVPTEELRKKEEELMRRVGQLNWEKDCLMKSLADCRAAFNLVEARLRV